METYILIFLCLAAFCAGFVDAIVGGGGLIQTPISILLLPQYAVSTVIGSLKIPAFSGTFLASRQYLKKVKIDYSLFCFMAITAFASAYFGSNLLTQVSNEFMKPALLVVLIALAIYTFIKKDFGQSKAKDIPKNKKYVYAFIISVVVGFYDGFIGPGTGSFFILGFITLLGFDFITASANAKLVNLATNFGSIVLFLIKGKIIWAFALPMAFCNGLGGYIGAKLAISKGNGFVRYFFLAIVLTTLCRFAYEIFFKG